MAPIDQVPPGLPFGQVQPMAGRFILEGASLLFIPRFPFRDGLEYAFLVAPLLAGRTCVWTIVRPSRPQEQSTTVTAIFPTAPDVPVNLLRIYVHFSAPMSEEQAARCLRASRDDTGEELEHVFLAMDPELWDPDRRRLTLLLEPGRIKRGLGPHEEAGYPLVEGIPFVVNVDSGFRDAQGAPLARAVERRYRVGPPIRRHVDPDEWQVYAPACGTTEPVRIAFDRPLDHALLEHCLRIVDSLGVPVTGRATIGLEEREWTFTPDSVWQDGSYVLETAHQLEDVAGNSVARVFDRDRTLPQDDPRPAEVRRRQFQIRP